MSHTILFGWAHLDSNQGPTGYEPAALTTELWAPIARIHASKISDARFRGNQIVGRRCEKSYHSEADNRPGDTPALSN